MQVIKNRKLLMGIENGKYGKVFISADRARTQRDEQREWRNKRFGEKKANEKSEAGTTEKEKGTENPLEKEESTQ